jgi:RNA polymerase sigma-70 factor (ECF subfamily)
MTRLSAIVAERRPPVVASDALEERLVALVEAAQRAWPGILVDGPTFVAYLAERLPPQVDAELTLPALHATDLYLACACAQRNPAAIAAFEREQLARVGSIVSRMDRSPDFADEVRQRLRERLLVGANGRIGEYTGAGPLAAWVRVATTRLALNVMREAKRSVTPRTVATPATPSPELDLIHERYRPQIEGAFRSAFAKLDGADRELLRLHYIEGLNQEEIARRRQMDRSTISRHIAGVRQQLLKRVHSELERLIPAIGANSRETLLRGLRSRIGFNLESVLKR